VDFLDSHPKIAICFHNATAIEEGTGASGLYCPPDQKRISTIADLWVRNFIPTCSAVVRRALVPELPEWFRTATFGDWPLYVLYALRGDIAYLPEVMATYRVHRGGAWSGQTGTQQLTSVIAMCKVFLRQLGAPHREALRAKISWCYSALAKHY